MIGLSPYLSFKGNATEAMKFYKECLGGELTLLTFKDSPMKDKVPAEKQNEIVHSALTADKFSVMATDMTGPEGMKEGNNVSLCFDCSSMDELNSLYTKLSAGAQTKRDPMEFFAGTLGSLTDKFGIQWLLYFDSVSKK